MNNITRSNFANNPFHLVESSPWPLIISFSLFILTTSTVMFFQNYTYGSDFLMIGLFCVVSSMAFWFRDIISEGSYQGHHTAAVQKGLTLGVALFIISEICFFLSIFWAFFHSALAPTIEIGGQWPPLGITAINPFELPLLNTILLLSSGTSVTYSHHSLIKGNRTATLVGLIITIILAAIFTFFQYIEYVTAPFTISDGAFGSCFYFATGFHGIHVIIGTIFLAVGLWRIRNYQLTNHHHLGFESAILYWHFVDIVWLFLFISIYYWGS
jgi:cytochrome c oxidase subunit 3